MRLSKNRNRPTSRPVYCGRWPAGSSELHRSTAMRNALLRGSLYSWLRRRESKSFGFDWNASVPICPFSSRGRDSRAQIREQPEKIDAESV